MPAQHDLGMKSLLGWKGDYMLIELSILPTPVAQVARRLNIIGNAHSADTFLAASYLAETAIKILAIAFYSGLHEQSPDHAYL
jgi:hypothetical protein